MHSKTMRAVVAACVVVLAGGGYVFYRLTTPGVSSPATSAPNPQAQGSVSGETSRGTAQGDVRTAAAPETGPSVRWMNVAAASLGGKVEHVSSVSKDFGWGAIQLIDGGTNEPSCAPFCSWSSATEAAFPQDIVLSFYRQREALIGRIVVDTQTSSSIRDTGDEVPRNIEIAVSASSPTDNFTPVASVELPPEAGPRAISFPPVRARYLRIRINSAHKGNRVLIGEVRVFEAETADPSILADFPRNLALPALGGGIIFSSSEYYDASQLIDGNPATEWRSTDGYVPQEFVFAFRDGRAALIDRIVLTTPQHLPGPKVIAVAVSMQNPAEGFEDAGRFTLEHNAADQSFPIHRPARFVRLRILEAYQGDMFSSIGEVQLIEGTAPGYESIVFGAGPPAGAVTQTDAVRDVDVTSGTAEAEPNNQAAQANRLDLGAAVRGAIDPIGENDFFRISVPGPDRSVLTFELSGLPHIRTSVNLLDASGATVKRFDPTRAASATAAFSWLVNPGDYQLQVTEPIASVVLVWDTSGSMERDTAALQRAVETYLDQVLPTERVNLIRFSAQGWRVTRPDIEVLLPEFSGDRSRLKKATEGKFDADGGTPFYDAVARAISLLESTGGNRLVIVMTDGEDSSSKMERREFWELLQTKGIRLYTIGLGDIDRYSRTLASTPQQLLQHAAISTNGRFFFTRNSGDLVKFYQQISDELRAPAAYRLRVTRAAATGTLDVRATGEHIAAIAAPAQIELILDASGSMNRASGKQRMIDTAKSVLTEIVQGLPDDVQVGLRVYGHRVREGRPGACEDSELVLPFAKLDKPRMVARIRAIQALGTTPIAYSLQQIARDVGQTPGEKLVVLVTDGKEECRGDPAAAVAALTSQGVKVRLNVVGFALADAALKADLQKLSAMTAGQFVEAKDASSLRAAIEQSLAVPYDVLDGTGAKVAGGVTGQRSLELPEGVYTLRVQAEKPIDVARVRIEAKETTTVELKKEGREVGVNVVAPR